jgi:CRP-like cAMP-binding protein
VKCFSTMPERVLVALASHVIPYHVCEGDVLYQPGDIGREAYIVRQGIDGAECEIIISQDHHADVRVTNGEMIGVNALQFGAADVVRNNTATVTAEGDLMLIPRWAVKEVELNYPLAGLKAAVQDYIKERNRKKIKRDATSRELMPTESDAKQQPQDDQALIKAGVIPCTSVVDVESTDSRLARIEERLATLEELLTRTLADKSTV